MKRVLIPILSLLASAPVRAAVTPTPPTQLYAVGGTAEFREFLHQAEGCELVFCTDFDNLPLATATNAFFAIAPCYPKGQRIIALLSDAQLDLLERAAARGNRFYFENVRAETKRACAFLGLQTFGETPVALEQKIIETDLGILQLLSDAYLPGAKYAQGKVKSRPAAVASVSDAIGVNSVYIPAGERSPVAVVSADGTRVHALVRLAPYDPARMRPYVRWRAFYAKLFAPLLGVDEAAVAAAFAKVWPNPIAAAGARTNDEVVRAALAWHERSGLFFAPDGTKGMKEALVSYNNSWRDHLRTDVTLMTGALFAQSGKIYGRPDWIARGRNLADFLLSRGIQTEDGYFRWFDRSTSNSGPFKVFATDHGRAMLAAVNLYEATGEGRYLKVARRAADAFLRWQSEDGLVTVTFDLRGKHVPAKGHSENPVCYYDNIPALFKLARVTGETKYAEAALRCAKTMSTRFPDFDLGNGAFYSANSVYGRYLLVAASAQRATDADFSKTINGVLDFYEKNQHAKGGIAEIKIRLVRHEEAGVGIGDGSDHIADLLYCNNFSFAALSILMKLPSEKVKGIDLAKARRIYGKLRGFLAGVQMVSADPRLDGAWMRAYDMDIGEWYGLNKDMGWGPYCIESGWTTGTIPAVFLFDGRDGSYF